MIAFKYRFHGHGSLRYVYKNGQAIRTHLVTVKYSRNPHRKNPRIGVVVSKKVLKSAVGRNRIRRRLYEALRPHITPDLPSYDVVFIVSSSEILAQSPSELNALVSDLMAQATTYTPDQKNDII
ncbi:MAG: putative Ribonuclease [Candidatus Saccharibacteria bacterium]|nr:putative Ribonuclease [Candidatus Saccharibacteria bacterium]